MKFRTGYFVFLKIADVNGRRKLRIEIADDSLSDSLMLVMEIEQWREIL